MYAHRTVVWKKLSAFSTFGFVIILFFKSHYNAALNIKMCILFIKAHQVIIYFTFTFLHKYFNILTFNYFYSVLISFNSIYFFQKKFLHSFSSCYFSVLIHFILISFFKKNVFLNSFSLLLSLFFCFSLFPFVTNIFKFQF